MVTLRFDESYGCYKIAADTDCRLEVPCRYREMTHFGKSRTEHLSGGSSYCSGEVVPAGA